MVSAARLVIPSAGLLVVLASGYVHGLQTERWGMSADAAEAAEKLNALPSAVGRWSSQQVEIPQRQLDMAGAIGCFSRRYVNRDDGRAVTVLVLCGRPGPISAHPPTVCFTYGGWELDSTPKRCVVAADGGASGEFWRGEFSRGVPGSGARIQALWSWGDGSRWVAADSPRREFAGAGFLYKVYVTSTAPGGRERAGDSPASSFLPLFLPEVERALSAPSSAEPPGAAAA